MANRLTQLAVDVAITTAAAARLSWVSAEMLYTGTAAARLSWLSVEVLHGYTERTKTVTGDYQLGLVRTLATSATAMLLGGSVRTVTAAATLIIYSKTVTAKGTLYRSYRTVSGSAVLIARTYTKTLTASAVLSSSVQSRVVSADAVLGAQVAAGTVRTVWGQALLIKHGVEYAGQRKTITAAAFLVKIVGGSGVNEVTGDAVLVKLAHTLQVTATAELSTDTSAAPQALSLFYSRRD